MVITTVICYLACWIPYGVIALLATFGKPGVVTPVASIIPSILAKSSTVCNPIIYILMNKQVRSAIFKLYFRQVLLGVLDFCVRLSCCVLVRKAFTAYPNNVSGVLGWKCL